MVNKQDLFIADYLKDFAVEDNQGSLSLFIPRNQTKVGFISLDNKNFPAYTNEFWTSKQRQASSLHEISYRACFKPQLPRFFINLLTQKGEVVYDPFSGRGTTVIEAGLLGRNIITNDVNPLSVILTKPRFFIPDILEIKNRLAIIPINKKSRGSIDLSMFYHSDTESEVVSLKNYFLSKKGREDFIDSWIKMIATNRLTGHSSGFFSVYTLPPNQAVSQESQKKINKKRNQIPEYRNAKGIILRKTKQLLSDISKEHKSLLKNVGENGLFLIGDARETLKIKSSTVKLTVTSPPFLDVVQYSSDNWLRCWFNGIDDKDVSRTITVARKIEDWSFVMAGVFRELYRITKSGGWVAFEVGEVRRGAVKLEEYIIPVGLKSGFDCVGVMLNQQKFTKTSNIWGIKNNSLGTNTNRIILFFKA